MSYKILEQNGIDNENVDGGAFNNFAAGGRDGIVGGVLSECALTAAGSAIGVSPGLIILHGIRVKVTGIETLSLSSVPIKPMSYQVVAQVTLASNGDVDFSIFIRTPQPLVQDPLYQNNVGVYQAELASFTHNPDGTISNLTKTLDIIYGSGGGSVNIEVGTVTTETLDAGLDADFDVTIRNGEGTNKILLDFDAKIPRGASGTDDQAVHFTPQGLSDSQKSQARKNIGADKSLYNLGAYDTYVDNGDGTATITRKTGYYKVPIENFVSDGTSLHVFQQYIDIPNAYSSYGNEDGYNHNAASNTYKLGNYNADDTFYISGDNYLRVKDTRYSSASALISALADVGGMFIQYELVTSYTKDVILDQPIHTLDVNGEQFVRDEWEKTLNLFNASWEQGTFNTDGTEVYIVSRVRSTKIQLDAGTYCISLSGADKKEVYSFSLSGEFLDSPGWLEGDTFTLPETRIISIACKNNDDSDISPEDISNVMLTKGSNSYPYVPYSGQIVHQGDPDMEFATSEWKKTLNLADWDGTEDYTKNQNTWTYLFIARLSVGVNYHLTIKNFSQNHLGHGGLFLVQSDTPNIPVPYQSLIGNPDQIVSWEYSPNGDKTADFTPSKEYVCLGIDTDGASKTLHVEDIMLVEGSHAYPYQPYNGAIVHEKQLNDALEDYPTNDELNTKLENYLPLTGSTINGNINAMGQVQEAGERVYSPNNPPPGISPQIYSIPITFVNIDASLIFGYTGRTYAHSIACRMPDGFVIPTDFIIGLETGYRNVSVPVCNFYTDNGTIFCGLVTYVTDARSVPSVPISANKEYKIICVKNPMT